MNNQSTDGAEAPETLAPANLAQANLVIAELRALLAQKARAEDDAETMRSALEELRDAAASVIGHPHQDGTLTRYARASDRARRALDASAAGRLDQYVIWSTVHGAWWRAKSAGYTNHLKAAGIYSAAEAVEICRTARDGFDDGNRPGELPIRLVDIGTLLFAGGEANFGGAPWRCTICGDFNHDVRQKCRRCPARRPTTARAA